MFLLEICCKENDLRVIAESLDAMFDVFGEDHLDPIVREIQMVEKLKTLLPSLKTQVRLSTFNIIDIRRCMCANETTHDPSHNLLK